METLSIKLAAQIKSSGFKPDYLVGIAIGGLVPLALLSEELNIGNMITISAHSYEGSKQGKLEITYLPKIDLSGKKILLIDEIAETGETLRQISETVSKQYNVAAVKTAALVVHSDKCRLKPDFYATEYTTWVILPWERYRIEPEAI